MLGEMIADRSTTLRSVSDGGSDAYGLFSTTSDI